MNGSNASNRKTPLLPLPSKVKPTPAAKYLEIGQALYAKGFQGYL
jgi:hypothetical protein